MLHHSLNELWLLALGQSLIALSSQPCSGGSLVCFAFSSPDLFDVHASPKVTLGSYRPPKGPSGDLSATIDDFSPEKILSPAQLCVLSCPAERGLLDMCMSTFPISNESSWWDTPTAFIFLWWLAYYWPYCRCLMNACLVDCMRYSPSLKITSK